LASSWSAIGVGELGDQARDLLAGALHLARERRAEPLLGHGLLAERAETARSDRDLLDQLVRWMARSASRCCCVLGRAA
jgi:hypothetical protein